MKMKVRGAVTYDTDEALNEGMQKIQAHVEALTNPFLTMEHIEPLGLHVTVHHDGQATQAQLDTSRQTLQYLASTAYSGYIDLKIDNGDAERFHAKEIAPKELTVDDIAST